MRYLLLVALSLAGLQALAYDKSQYLPPLPLDKYLDSLYLDHALGLRAGTPTSRQSERVESYEVYLRQEFARYNFGLLIPSAEVGVAHLAAGTDYGYVFSAGPAFAIPMAGFSSRLLFVAHGKVVWLTRYEFEDIDYGGPLQWNYGFGGKYQIERNAYLEYTWQHMSNGDRYDTNPSLETRNLTFGINF
ncbi:acyloxyacyl hydrolase [Thalassolituus sp. LLYu03]|uniref:acyloxyacyl hydrolase n=1 Tax=Thalassolituus sp. LLYu03 TaxID=3421656 RepID=UPI003D29A34A